MFLHDWDEMATRGIGLTSFTAVGHLILVNLKENLLPQKHAIGKALLENNKRAVAVCNKINSIENQFRTSEIEIIAKRPECSLTDEELMICEVNQNKCRFQLDISKVYWNSRLSTEHERFVNSLKKPTDVIFDVCAGVGPFSVPAAKAKCKTFANDLNPDSVKWLRANMKRNKVDPKTYEIFEKDAKDFISVDIRRELINLYEEIAEQETATLPTIHILMNLPASAPTFLPHFIGLFQEDRTVEINGKSLLETFQEQSLEHIVYCYCFLKLTDKGPDEELLVRNIVEEGLGRSLTKNQLVEIFKVRNVAPFKHMYRVKIRLDEDILFGDKDLVSIMKRPSSSATPLTNGTSKKVTMNVSGVTRRPSERNSDSETSTDEEPEAKRTRPNSYCAVI